MWLDSPASSVPFSDGSFHQPLPQNEIGKRAGVSSCYSEAIHQDRKRKSYIGMLMSLCG